MARTPARTRQTRGRNALQTGALHLAGAVAAVYAESEPGRTNTMLPLPETHAAHPLNPLPGRFLPGDRVQYCGVLRDMWLEASPWDDRCTLVGTVRGRSAGETVLVIWDGTPHPEPTHPSVLERARE